MPLRIVGIVNEKPLTFLMITAQERRQIVRKLIEFEAPLNYMYLDTKGLVTVGIGHQIFSAEDAQQIPFLDGANKPVSKEEIKRQFDLLKGSFLPNYKATSYKSLTSIHISEETMADLMDANLQDCDRQLRLLFPGFDRYPSNVRLVLFDMAFNGGVGSLKGGYPKFVDAIKRGNWRAAAGESHRKWPIRESRNQYVKDLLMKQELLDVTK